MVRSALFALSDKGMPPAVPSRLFIPYIVKYLIRQHTAQAFDRTRPAYRFSLSPGEVRAQALLLRVLGEEPFGQVVHQGDEAETGMLYVFPSECRQRIAEGERVRPCSPPDREFPHGGVRSGRADGARSVEPVYLVKPPAVMTGIDRPAVQGRLA